ncbi:MAG: hypothetical protein PHE55_15910 [Methylococcaceae bacterium]|nr:hypothetical protein [Methylococcaceae bacterium]
MIRTVRKFKEVIIRLGWGDGLFYVSVVLLKSLGIPVTVRKYYLLAQAVPADPFIPPSPKNRISVRQILPEEYRTEWFPRPQEVIDARFGQGAVCFVAFDQAEPVGCIWFCPGPYLEDEVRCCFVPEPAGQAVWDFDVYVYPKYRLGRTFLYLWDYGNLWLRNNGYAWSMSRVDCLNRESLNSHQRLGAVKSGSAIFITCCDMQLMLANLFPYVHASFSNRAIPKLSISPS